jgi:hypothetical protein
LQLRDDHRMEPGTAPPPAGAGVGAVVEVVLLSAAPNLRVPRYRMRTAPLDGHRHPDAVARDLAGLGDGPAGLLHSTSWRFLHNRVVVTYAALPDPDPLDAVPVPGDGGASGAGPLAPAPARITADDIAAHACRHLAYLRHTDPLVAARAGAVPGLWQLIAAFTPAVAGLLVQPDLTAVR